MENDQTKVNNFMAIPRPLLLHVYWIVPVLLGVVLYDMFYLNSRLLPHLGIEALLLPLFILLFNFPHIIASFFSFLDREYVSHYKKYLFGYLPLLLIGTAILLYIDYRLGLVFYLLNDIWHGIKQKVGIALILGAKPGWLHRVWTLSAFFISAIAYVYIMFPDAYPPSTVSYISPVLFGGVVFFFISMIVMVWKSIPAVRWYIFFVSALLLCSYFFILAGYVFFAILAFRFVHDISAFSFYVTHDHNRKRSGKNNWLYRFLSIVPAPVLIITPLLGVLFAYLVNTATNGLAIGYSIVVLIGMTHFYLESVMWKRNSPHRQYVKVE